MKITTLDSLNLRKDPEKPQEINQSQEAPVAAEGITSKGEARYKAISTFISGAGEKVSGWWKRGKELFKTGAVGVLSTPEAVAAGGKFVGEKVEQGVDFVDEKIERGKEIILEKSYEAGKWVGGNARSVYEFGAKQYNRAEQFVGNKAHDMEEYMAQKALLLEAIASLVAEKTAEKAERAKQALEDNYRRMLEYAKNALDSAALRTQAAKEKFNQRKNAIYEAVLMRMAEIQAEKLQQTLAKLAQLKALDQLNTQPAE